MLASGRGHSTEELAARLEVSRSTIKRDLRYLSDRLGVPVRRSIEHGGWIVDRADSGSAVELPGLWLTAEEIRSLLAMQQWLTSLDAGAPIRPRRLGEVFGTSSPAPWRCSTCWSGMHPITRRSWGRGVSCWRPPVRRQRPQRLRVSTRHRSSGR
ncbi:MAG: HTH domain-containing protein [Burkholderiales bacterium]|nr:HTH domain-containing protein [Burkholderiales bacterium]